MKMIGILHSSSFNLACNCKPDIFGIRISTIRHAARVRKSDSRNSSADPKHCATSPAASIRSRSESCMASSSSMIAINLDVSRARAARGWLPHWLRSIRVCPLSRDPLINVNREQKRYITIRAGSGCNIPRVSEILAEYTLLDTPGRYFCDTHHQGEGLLCGL